MFFRQGHIYMGGADVPFFVPLSAIANEASNSGFDQVQVVARSKVPLVQIPPQWQGGGWNTFAQGRRVAPDGDVPMPSEVKWVVDITPTPIIVAGSSTPSPEMPSGSESLPEWMPLPPVRPLPDTSGPPVINVPSGLGYPIMVGCGVIGGAFFAYQGMSHFFGSGITPKEKKNILLYSASVLAVWGLSQVIDLDKMWWASPEGIAAKAKELNP